VVVSYRNQRSRGPVEWKVRPLLAFRDYNNTLAERDENVDLEVERAPGCCRSSRTRSCHGYTFTRKRTRWIRRRIGICSSRIAVEEERGLGFRGGFVHAV